MQWVVLKSLIRCGSCVDHAEALYLVEGAGQVGLGLSWGDGFAHVRSLLDAEKFVSDPSHFFRSLVRARACLPAATSMLACKRLARNCMTVQSAAVLIQLAAGNGAA